jgi:hypothetical protein
MKPSLDKFKAKLNSDVIAPLEKEFGLKFSDYEGLAQGQSTLAFVPTAGEEGQPPKGAFLFLMDARAKSSQLASNLATLRKKWVDAGKTIRTEKIRDLEFSVLIFSSDDLKKTLDQVFPDPNAGYETKEAPKPQKPPQKFEWWLGQSESLLLLGSAPKAIEKVLIRQSGGAVPSLSEHPGFSSSYSRLLRDAQAYAWVNVKAITEGIAKAQPSESGSGRRRGGAPNTGQILDALGLTSVQTVALNIQDARDGATFELHIQAPAASRKGLFKIISFEADEAAPPPFVPADAVKFTRWRLNLKKAWDALESTVGELSPQGAGVMKMMIDSAGKDKDPDFNLRESLLANLGDDLITYEKTPRRQTLADLQSAPALALIQSPKAEQMAAALRALSSLMPQQGAKLKEREFLGRKVYSLPLPSGPRGPKTGERSLHFAASGGYVALSSDVAMLEEYLRGSPGKSLREQPGLAEAAQRAGGMDTGLFGYENQAETMRAMLEILKKESGTLANLFSGTPFAERLGMGENSTQFKDWVDFSLLPPFDKIAKYFHLEVWTGTANAEGLAFKAYTPFSPEFRR